MFLSFNDNNSMIDLVFIFKLKFDLFFFVGKTKSVHIKCYIR